MRATSQIGRDLTCEVVVGDAEASRRHAELIATDGDRWQVRDLSSTNGTFVNDRRVVGTVDVRPASDVVAHRVRVSVELHAHRPPPVGTLTSTDRGCNPSAARAVVGACKHYPAASRPGRRSRTTRRGDLR